MAETFVASATVAELFSCYLGDTPQINTGGVPNPNPLGGDCNKDRRTGLNNIPPSLLMIMIPLVSSVEALESV